MSAVLDTVALPSRWRVALPAMVAVLLAIGLLYRDTFVAMAGIWTRSETFAHAWLVPPIVLWLVWRMRAELARLVPKPAPWLLLPMAVVAFGWLLGDLGGVNAVTQLAVTALLVLAVPAVLGMAVTRQLQFPLAFLFFMVPVGEFMLDPMMEWTADFTIWALIATGIPVYREGLQFIIPSGAWSVVEACSGVRYLIASFMVGTLFAYLNYQSPTRRWIFVGVSILVPIVANWVRAYGIVMLGHLSGNTIAVGVDHLIYGWVFFGVVIGIMFVVGARWAESPAEAVADASWSSSLGEPVPAAVQWRGAIAALAVAAVAPVVAAMLALPATTPPVALVLPALPGTEPAADQSLPLPPRFEGAAAETHRVYRLDDGSEVAVHLAYYRHQRYGAKLTSSNNLLIRSDDSEWNRLSGGRTTLSVDGEPLVLRRAELLRGRTGATLLRQHLQVRQLLWSGGHLTDSDHRATAWGVLGRLAGRGDDGATLSFYAVGEGPETAARLDAFVARHLPALVAELERVRASAP